jgi:hypothetical protein
MGFQSQSQFQKHWLRCHQDVTTSPNQPIDDPDDDEIQPLLFDLVTMGKLDEVTRLLPRFCMLPYEVKTELKNLAAFTGPLAMVRVLIENDNTEEYVWAQIITKSMEGENIEVLSWVASEYQLRKYNPDFLLPGNAAMSGSAEVFELWKKNFSKLNVYGTPLILDRSFIRAAKGPMQEIRVSTLWKERALFGERSTVRWGNALKTVAETTCSVILAKTLLECGADVDFRRTNNRSERTPLHLAATKTTVAAAELMKFLLLSGADPDVSVEVKRDKIEHKYQRVERRTPSMERGGQNISKWLGMTWDQLVKWAEEQRREISQNDAGS